jgi:hypothetical protein
VYGEAILSNAAAWVRLAADDATIDVLGLAASP